MASSYTDALVPVSLLKSVGTSETGISTLTIPVLCIEFTVQANFANTGRIFVGQTGLSSSSAIHLNAGDAFHAQVIYAGGTNYRQYDLTQWFLRASAASQKASVTQVRLSRSV